MVLIYDHGLVLGLEVLKITAYLDDREGKNKAPSYLGTGLCS